MQQHGSQYFADPPPTHTHTHHSGSWVWSIGQNSTFSKHGHVVYQIKWNHECSKIASILPTDSYHSHPWPLGWGEKVESHIFHNMVMLHIILKGITNVAAWYKINCPQITPYPDPVNRVKCQISTFSEHSHGTYQIKGNHVCSNMVANILPVACPLPLPLTLMRLIGPNSTFSEHGHIAYQIILGNHECSNMVAKFCPQSPLASTPLPSPPPDPEGGVNRSKFIFSQHGRVAYFVYQIKGNRECSNMVANFLPAVPPLPAHPYPLPPTLGVGSTGQNSFFTTWSCCISNNQGNHECSKMVAKFCPHALTHH